MGNVMNDNKRNIRSERSVPARHRLCAGMLTALAALVASAPAYAQRSDTPQSYSIQAGSLGDALNQLARQSKLQIRSEEHTSELQSLMRISYAVFCLKKQ